MSVHVFSKKLMSSRFFYDELSSLLWNAKQKAKVAIHLLFRQAKRSQFYRVAHWKHVAKKHKFLQIMKAKRNSKELTETAYVCHNFLRNSVERPYQAQIQFDLSIATKIKIHLVSVMVASQMCIFFVNRWITC